MEFRRGRKSLVLHQSTKKCVMNLVHCTWSIQSVRSIFVYFIGAHSHESLPAPKTTVNRSQMKSCRKDTVSAFVLIFLIVSLHNIPQTPKQKLWKNETLWFQNALTRTHGNLIIIQWNSVCLSVIDNVRKNRRKNWPKLHSFVYEKRVTRKHAVEQLIVLWPSIR